MHHEHKRRHAQQCDRVEILQRVKADLGVKMGIKYEWPAQRTSKVYPSAGLLATNFAPMFPPAPGLFSTMTGCPSDWASRSETIRARMSFPPPGANGTTNLTD